MDLELGGKIAVVTGTSIGIGREIAKVLAAEGVILALVARRGELLCELQEEIAATGAAKPLAIARDVTAPNAHLEIRDEVLAAYGHIDIFVNNAAYSAKAAVHAWAKGLSREIGKFGITINSLAPGRIISEQIVNRINPGDAHRDQFARDNIPLGYFGEPRDMAYAVTFLASPKARYITGESLAIDGGMRRFAF